ncbi:DUF6531 domain-containing protein [Streptomyces sedi]|uniref:Rhs protein n=1 Tax=Streptomyces sedi TaxID=555059 RepID=A0A5C4UTM0_9ACTN|nr:DUF6531 domain-containing protein [Streptomyces sedi]TNM27001.1 hypothetical protein FH715_21815 [Streptomyces sedi]
MVRASDWSPVDMDRDPTPGDPDEVRELADDLQEFADDVGEALGKIRGLASERAVLDWAGLSADAFRAEFDGVPDNLTKLEESYSLCARALQTYWPKLQTAQGMADRALDRAISAQADLASAQSALGDATDWVGRAGDEAERLQREGERENVEPPDEDDVRAAARDRQAAEAAAGAARSRVDDAEERLSAARQLAQDAQEMREEAARECARDIDEASDAGIQNKKWWEKAIEWVTDAWETLVAVCKVVVAVLGIVVLIIGGPLAWVVLAAAVVVLADTLIKFAQGKAGLLDVAFAALDCIPGMKGLTTLGGLARGLRGGLSAARNGLRTIGNGIRRLGPTLRQGASDLYASAVDFVKRLKCRDPVDPCTGDMILQETDLNLPAVLPLVLDRTHVSSYRHGGWFGHAWASTLDQRLEIDDQGVCYAAPDGAILVYPVPGPDEDVPPLAGARRTLRWDGRAGGAFQLSDPVEGHTLHFAPVPGMWQRAEVTTLPLTAITSRNGQRIDIDRAPDGTPLALRHSAGYHIEVETRDTRIAALRLQATGEELVRYGYDEAGRLTEVRDPAGDPVRFHYDRDGRVTGWVDRLGTAYDYEFDAEGRVVRVAGSEGLLAGTFSYDRAQRVTEVTDSQGQTIRYQFNEFSQLVSETDPLGHETVSEQDPVHGIIARTDPLGRTTRFTYDERGNLTSTTLPDGATSTLTFNDLGLPTALTEPGGLRWEQTYDAAGNRLSSTDPVGATTRYEYDENGGLSAVTDALGAVTRIETDAAGLPRTVTDPLGATTSYRRDALGRVTSVTDPAGTTHHTWTIDGKPTSRTRPDGTTEHWSWDSQGNLVAHTDPAGQVTHFEVGHFGLVRAQIEPDGSRLEFTHDTELRLVGVTNQLGLTWTYTYDAAGRLVREQDFDGRVLRYAHDPAGQLVARTNGAGQTLRFEHDIRGQVTAVHAEEHTTTYARDEAGHLVQAVAPGVELLLDRDPLGQVLSETCNGRTLTNTYDVLGRRTERRTPHGAVSHWTHDDASRPTALRTADGGSLTFTHDASGRETARQVGRGTTLTQNWDSAQRLTGQTLSVGGETIHQRTFRYAPTGALASLTDPDGTRDVTTDAVGRVTAIRARGWSEGYAYDAAGNLTNAALPETGGASTVSGDDGGRSYQGTRLRRAGRTFYAHDAQGRVVRQTRKLLSGGTRAWTYSWDAADRLTDLTTPDGHHWHYLYDPLGRRIAKQHLGDDGSVIRQVDFVWDGNRLAEQVDSADQTCHTWDWSPGSHRVVAQRERALGPDSPQEEYDRRFYAIVSDLAGTPTELVDEDGQLAWRDRRTLWGRSASRDPDGAHCPLRFPGQYLDDESGLHYNLFRYYDPDNARYLTPDPLGLAAAPNAYAYVPDPWRWIDPLGLVCADANTVHGHIADVRIVSPNGTTRLEYGLWSGRTTPAETAATKPGFDRMAVTHTEHRISRMSGASTGPRINIPNDPYFNEIPVQRGESVYIDAVLPPCSRCRGAMNRMVNELGVNVTYSWDGPEGAGQWARQA